MSKISSLAVLKMPYFGSFLIGRAAITFGVNMLSTIVLKQVFDLSKSELALGLVGLSEFLPFAVLILYAGYLTDIFDRRRILQLCNMTYAICAFCLFLLSTSFSWVLERHGVLPIYIVMAIIGAARAFVAPAQSAFLPNLVPIEKLPEAANLSTLVWHFSAILGPALAGLLFVAFGGVAYIYLISCVLALVSVFAFGFIKVVFAPEKNLRAEGALTSIKAGLQFVFKNEVILASLSLDMFAVLFGGAVAVLPAFAEKVLQTDAVGFGWLRAAPAIGAFLMGLGIAGRPLRKHVGKKMLLSVGGFGVCILVFALSENYWLSFIALLGTGAFDNVSMVTRGTIVPLFTPDEMRGRVGSVNGLFIGSSNELGAFESGLAAWAMGLVPSVVFGGSMTLVVVLLTWFLAPKLRELSYD